MSWVYIILGGQWPAKPTYDPKVPWALPDAERARKVRLALNLGTADLGQVAIDVGYLAALATAGLLAGNRTYRRRLYV